MRTSDPTTDAPPPKPAEPEQGQWYYCEVCCKETWHTRSELGDFEIFKCTEPNCGFPHTVRTR